MAAERRDRRDRILLLDIGVERVVHAGDIGMVDRVEIGGKAFHRQ